MHDAPRLDARRITLYLVFSFGIAWLVGLIIFLRGGLADSRVLIPELGITEALALLAAGYMTARSGEAIQWNARGQLSGVGSRIQLAWDARGRLRSIGPSQQTLYLD